VVGARDKAHALTKGAISGVPAVGGVAAELFALVIASPLERRQSEWAKAVAETVVRLEGEFSKLPEDLANDEAFLSTVLQASHTALRTHHQEKRQALRNAILNTGVGSSPDETVREMFIGLIGDFTVWHLRLLAFFNSSHRIAELHQAHFGAHTRGSLTQILQREFPDLSKRMPLVMQIVAELKQTGLLASTVYLSVDEAGKGNDIQDPAAFSASFTTSLGDEFLTFIREPVAQTSSSHA
jgi:hypothetical protein